jgi:hypothetical protein
MSKADHSDTTRRRFLTSAAVAIVPLPIAAAGQALDAGLIELGVRLEPLVDRYYVAHRRWSHSLAAAHAEHDAEFGDPADRDHEYPPHIVAAFDDSCERSGAHEADDALSAIIEEMRPLEIAIKAAPANSIEGLRARRRWLRSGRSPRCLRVTLSFISVTLIRSSSSSPPS